MQDAQFSRTAIRVAARRAAHQVLDRPLVLEDPIALEMVGPEAVAQIPTSTNTFLGRPGLALRAFLVARSRLAEDELARAIHRGTAQYVILGAGLDTFAYRHADAATSLRVFEVDHPATQEWKRRKLAMSSIAVPASLTFAPVDFERQTLAAGLAAAGFDANRPAFFSWLGVTMYLTDAAITSTLQFIVSLPRGGGIAFDYSVPRASLNFLERLAFDRLSRRVATAGEPFVTFLDPAMVRTRLTTLGFREIVDFGRDEINARYFSGRRDGLRIYGRLGRIVSAEV